MIKDVKYSKRNAYLKNYSLNITHSTKFTFFSFNSVTFASYSLLSRLPVSN